MINLELKVGRANIKDYFKQDINYSYKKGGSTWTIGESEKAQFLKSIFTSRILKMLLKDLLIINIDEWSF